jgi:hypothetical protein
MVEKMAPVRPLYRRPLRRLILTRHCLSITLRKVDLQETFRRESVTSPFLESTFPHRTGISIGRDKEEETSDKQSVGTDGRTQRKDLEIKTAKAAGVRYD